MPFSVRTARVLVMAAALFAITAPVLANASNTAPNAGVTNVYQHGAHAVAAMSTISPDDGVGWD